MNNQFNSIEKSYIYIIDKNKNSYIKFGKFKIKTDQIERVKKILKIFKLNKVKEELKAEKRANNDKLKFLQKKEEFGLKYSQSESKYNSSYFTKRDLESFLKGIHFNYSNKEGIQPKTVLNEISQKINKLKTFQSKVQIENLNKAKTENFCEDDIFSGYHYTNIRADSGRGELMLQKLYFTGVKSSLIEGFEIIEYDYEGKNSVSEKNIVGEVIKVEGSEEISLREEFERLRIEDDQKIEINDSKEFKRSDQSKIPQNSNNLTSKFLVNDTKIDIKDTVEAQQPEICHHSSKNYKSGYKLAINKRPIKGRETLTNESYAMTTKTDSIYNNSYINIQNNQAIDQTLNVSRRKNFSNWDPIYKNNNNYVSRSGDINSSLPVNHINIKNNECSKNFKQYNKDCNQFNSKININRKKEMNQLLKFLNNIFKEKDSDQISCQEEADIKCSFHTFSDESEESGTNQFRNVKAVKDK